MADKFWSVVESTLKYDIAAHVKASISMSGFAHPLTFTQINDDDIARMEKFMREEALELAISNIRASIGKKTDESCDILLDEVQAILDNQKTEMFGKTFALCPEKFHFLPGDISCIKLLVVHVTELVSTKSGRLQFKEKKRKKINIPFHQLRNCDEPELTNQTVGISELTNEKLAGELFDKVIACMKSFGLDTTEWNGSLVEVDQSGTFGSVHCILCDEKSNPKKRVYYCNSATRSSYWVLSNFAKHLEDTHSLISDRPSKKKSKKSHINPSAISKTNSVSEWQNQSANLHVDTIEYDQKPVIKCESIVKHEHDLQNSEENNANQTLELSVEIVGCTVEINDSLLFDQISQQMQQMIMAITTNGEPEAKMEFRLKGHSVYLSVVETEPDGNCLFSALAHQLWRNAIKSRKHKRMTKSLRSAVVDHILNADNFPRFSHALEERLRERQNIEKIDDLTAECKIFVRHDLSRDGQWGGLETIKAASCMHRVNVVVFNEKGPCYIIKGASEEYDRTITIAYRLQTNGNGDCTYYHYDSVSEMDSDCIYSASQFIANK